jgi:hypothetical protein
MKIMTTSKVCFCAVIAVLVSGCEVTFTPANVPPPGPVVVEAVPPAYVWDGVEYVGVYNGGYMYLNPGGVWLVCDPVVLERFHGYERYHPDWRRTAIRNEGANRRGRDAGGERRDVQPARRTTQQTGGPAQRTATTPKKTTAPAKKAAPVKKDDNK